MSQKQGSLALLACIFIGLTGAVSGDCAFPANYQNRFWFRMFSYNSNSSWNYRLLQPDVITDNQWDNNTNFRIPYPCQDLYLINQSVLYYLTSNKYCAKLVITDDNSAVLIQELDVTSYALTSASQCAPLLNETCLAGRCSALWMPNVNQLTAPPQFSTSIQCPFQGVYQLSVDYGGSSNVCLANGQSTAAASGNSFQFNVCNQNNLQNTMFKQGVTLLTQSTVCMAQLPGDAVNTDETGCKVVLLRYQNSLFCARYKTDASGNILLAINIKNVTSAYCGPGMSNATSGSMLNNTILLRLGQLPSTTSTTVLTTIPTSIPATLITTSTSATPSTTTTLQTTYFPSTVSTPGPTSTATTTTISAAAATTTNATTTTSIATSSTSSNTVGPSSASPSSASTTASTTSGIISSTTSGIMTSTTSGITASSTSGIMTSSTSGIMASPTTTTSSNASPASGISTSTTANPSNLVTSPQNGLATATVTTSFIALTSAATGSSGGPSSDPPGPGNLNNSGVNCPGGTCGKGAFCNQTSGSCQCNSAFYRYSIGDSRCVQDDESIDDIYLKVVVPIIVISTLGSIVAGLVLCITANPPLSAGFDAPLVPASKTVTLPPPQPIRNPDPAYVTYGRNLETYANIESIDKSLVTYGNETLPKPLDNNYALVRSSIPPKM